MLLFLEVLCAAEPLGVGRMLSCWATQRETWRGMGRAELAIGSRVPRFGFREQRTQILR